MTAFIQLQYSGVKMLGFVSISGVKGMQWRRFHMESVVHTTNRKLTLQGE
jgi:hypothetical protein